MSTATASDPLAGLNAAQRDAVMHHEGPLLVLAGAGSGKTRVLTTRVARLIEHHGVPAREILAVTFTNKAAGEMRDRIARLLGAEPQGMWSGTFHAIGARLLRSGAACVGRTPGFTIYDEDDTLGVVRRIMERRGISPKQWTPKAIIAAISDAKNALVPPAEYARLAAEPFARAAASVYGDLEGVLRAANAVSFDDLLVLPVQILREQPDRLAAYQARFRHILVDEYQDTNRAQYEFIRLLGASHGNVVVVGDDDQSIYGWRGADIRNILDFEKDFPGAGIVRLEENYRSAPEILDIANVVISANTTRRGKTLRATRPAGERVTVIAALDDRDEADAVAEEIVARRNTDGLTLRAFAVLYRTNAQSRPMEEAMRKRGLPYRLVGSVRFYDRREIRDLVSYLKLIANPRDDEAFRRAVAVPRRGLGDTTIELLAERARTAGVPMLEAATRADLLEGMRTAARAALGEFAALVRSLGQRATGLAADELLGELVDAIRYGDYLKAEGPESADRLDNVRELITSAAETVADDGGEVGLTPLDHFLQRAMLIAGADALDPSADAVTMMTMHNAKGLEYPVVFITGLEDGLFPLARAFDDPPLLEEERRLFYVGITRAERKLYLTHAEQRRRNGELMMSRASSFLMAIPQTRLEWRRTIRLRSSGRSAFGGQAAFGSRGHSAQPFEGTSTRAADRRPGTPYAPAVFADDSEVSQDTPDIVIGGRVKHVKFGSGTISEITGTGRAAKVRVDFDDETIGSKTLVVAQANLQRGWE